MAITCNQKQRVEAAEKEEKRIQMIFWLPELKEPKTDKKSIGSEKNVNKSFFLNLAKMHEKRRPEKIQGCGYINLTYELDLRPDERKREKLNIR